MEGGDGLGYFRDKAVFVPLGAPGDVVMGVVVKETPDWMTLEPRKALTLSPERVEPSCEVFGRCGGCQWQHLSYGAQLRWKKEIVREAFARIAGVREIPIEDTRPSPTPFPFLYRNKAIIPLAWRDGRILMGFYRRGTHEVVDAPECPVLAGPLNSLWHGIRALLAEEPITVYDERRHFGKLRHLVLRMGMNTGEILVGFVVKEPAIARRFAEKVRALSPRVVGVFENINPRKTNVIFGNETRTITGQGFFRERVLHHAYRVSALSFFQVNTPAVEALIREWQADLPEMDTAVDAYAGVGLFSLFLAERARKVIAVEMATPSVLDLEANVRNAGLPNVEVRVGPVEAHAPDFPEKVDLLVVDPPRQGLEARVLAEVIRRRIPEIHYLSCKPSTLARDARVLLEAGYELVRLTPWDFFPQTHHVETFARFRRKG